MQHTTMVRHSWTAGEYKYGEQALQANDAAKVAEQCLKDTGAIKRCPGSTDAYLMVNDQGAEQEAYVRAEHLRRAGLRGFRGLTQQEVYEATKLALESYRTETRA
jgi:hypothetical protein